MFGLDAARAMFGSNSPASTSTAPAESSAAATLTDATCSASSRASEAAVIVEGTADMRYEWWWLDFEQKMPVRVDQWKQYDPAVTVHLSASYAAMKLENRDSGLVLDLEAWSNPPSPYQVWRGKPIEVCNPNEPTRRRGGLSIAGYDRELWEFPQEQLPPSARKGKCIKGFYQIFKPHVPLLEQLEKHLADGSARALAPSEQVRRRVVMLIEIERPNFMFAGVDRFRKKRHGKAATEKAEPVHDPVPPGDAVFQWWFGDPRPGGWGHWKSYLPHVSNKLEEAYTSNWSFREGQEAFPIDAVRYSLKKVTRERPFDFMDQQHAGTIFREPFMPQNVLTVDCPLYDEATRALGNCFVQFQNGNPKRRRPVRRIRRGEAAGREMPEGDPCTVCWSDTGFLTGCDKGCIICGSCLRSGLRIAAGDITTTEGLVCGCLCVKDRIAFDSLTQKADAQFQELYVNPPDDAISLKEFTMELAQLRRCFQLPSSPPPADLFQRRISEWRELVAKRLSEHLYHACSHPGCGIENWILREVFDAEYRSKSLNVWKCKAGHMNSVLPSQADIDEINRNLLSHPEHYSHELRRFRVCPPCLQEGLLTFAVHHSGCKQWPGYGDGHWHVFCFICTGEWQKECGHAKQCKDPGIQQVRKVQGHDSLETLEIGFVDSAKYIAWMEGKRSACPPTVFRGFEVRGDTRQGQLGMSDRQELLRVMREGTQ
eukprot:TRINITY_DN40718_c0_g1_i1.p1 TRINITY_DN40718_c0_g1~~TRINITY_DN40718_c0_g1_i1.p1  ORF type:complete len:711 (-),score=118.83 TRINITY_DN40718_c0_g1_i1:160-2292(-)